MLYRALRLLALIFGLCQALWAQPFALVTHFESAGAMSVIDITSGKVVGNPIKLGKFPQWMAPTPDGKEVLVANSGDGTVDVIDTSTWQVVGIPIKVGGTPCTIAITPDGKLAFVINKENGTPINKVDGTVSIIDIATREVIGNPIKVQKLPHEIAITPNGKLALITNGQSDSVSVIDIGKEHVVQTIKVGWQPFWIAITPDGRSALIANGAGSINVIDIETLSVVGNPIKVGGQPSGIAITPNGKLALVVNPQDGIVLTIDIATLKIVGNPIKVKGNLSRIAITQDGKSALITNYELAGTVIVIDIASQKVVDTINAGKKPVGIAIVPMPSKEEKELKLMQKEESLNKVVFLGSKEKLKPVKGVNSEDKLIDIKEKQPSKIMPQAEFKPEQLALVIHHEEGGAVSVIDIAKGIVVGNPMKLGGHIYAIAITPDGKKALITNGAGSVNFIDIATLKVVGNPIKVGGNPMELPLLLTESWLLSLI